MSRFVVKPTTTGTSTVAEGVAGAEPLEDTGLFLADAADPREVVKGSEEIAWAAPIVGSDDESYPTGEVSIRFSTAPEPAALESFVEKHGLELRQRNEFIPEQIVVAPTRHPGTWLPDLVDRLNGEGLVAKAWPNTLSRYRRA